MAIFTHGNGPVTRCLVEQFKIELIFEHFNSKFL